MTDRPLIAITLGDPSGVGPEVVAKALADPALHEAARLFVVGAVEPLQAALAQTATTSRISASPIRPIEMFGVLIFPSPFP